MGGDALHNQASLGPCTHSTSRTDRRGASARARSDQNSLQYVATPRVLLLSLKAGGVGLNLTGACHLVVHDLFWNPAIEQQASDRIHRLGQHRTCFIHKFVVHDSVEHRILDVQEKKKGLASSVIEGYAF